MSRTSLGYIVLAAALLLGGCSDSATKGKSAQESAIAQAPPGSKWEGQLIQRPGSAPEDGKVFLVRDGKRHWVVTADWLKLHGYKFPDDVHVISASELAQIPEGEVIQ